MAGAGYGLATAGVLFLMILFRGPQMGARYDLSGMLKDIVQPLLACGLAGGALVGPLRPLMRTVPGAAVVGAAAGGVLGITMQVIPQGWEGYENWVTFYVAALLSGVFAFRRWRQPPGHSKRTA